MHDERSRPQNGATERRGFIKLFGLGAAAGSVGLVRGALPAAADPATPAAERGYRETAHVRKVYELARF